MNLQLTGSNMKELFEELLTFPTLVKMSLNVWIFLHDESGINIFSMKQKSKTMADCLEAFEDFLSKCSLTSAEISVPFLQNTTNYR